MIIRYKLVDPHFVTIDIELTSVAADNSMEFNSATKRVEERMRERIAEYVIYPNFLHLPF